MNIKKYLVEKKEIIDEALDKYLPAEEEYPSSVHQAIRYSIFPGGKRIRPIFTLTAAEIMNGRGVLSIACALELIHTYSLIHDDLPSMDNDDYRRGKLSCHKMYGEALALLTGDALLTYAFQLITETSSNPVKKLKIINKIVKAIGTQGMIGGQVVELEAKGKMFTPDLLQYIHTHKTGALIQISLEAGALLGEANTQELEALSSYGENIGLAFQIVDDIFDGGHYIHLYGEKRAKASAKELVNKAKERLNIFGKKGIILSALADFILEG